MLTTTKRLLMRCIATLCVATVFLVRAEGTDASIATQLAKLLPSDGANSDSFGGHVAISDGIAVVGSWLDDDKGTTSGSVYVFEMSSPNDASSWTQVAKLTAADGASQDMFGYQLAIGDGTIVVAAHGDDDKGSSSGSAYVFEMSSPGDANSFTQVAKLTAADGAAGDGFGRVAVGDGTIVVGALCDDDHGSCSGSVYVFEKSSSDDPSSWKQVAKLTADDGAADDYFGSQVGVSDGIIVVGSQGDDDKGSGSGSAYLFQKSSSDDASSWTQVSKLTADDGAAGDVFTNSVAINDGTVVVGASHSDAKGSNSGAAYVYEMSSSGDASSFTQVAKLTADDGAAADRLGNFGGLSISSGIIVIGARGDDDKGSDSGSVYVFEQSSSSDAGSWTQVAKLTADDGANNDMFGHSVAISDGTVIVGSPNDDDNGSNSGSAYIFQMKTEPPPPPPPTPPPPTPPPTPPPPPSPPPSPPPPTTVYTTTFEDRTFTTIVVKQDDGTFKESVSSSPLSALGLAPGGPTFPRVSAVVTVIAFVALLASVAARRTRETKINREEGEALLNSNKYGAVNA